MINEYLSYEEVELLKSDQEYATVISKRVNELDFDKAKLVYKNLIESCQKLDMKRAEAWFSTNLGWVYFDTLNLEKALELHIKAFNVFEKCNNKEGVLRTINGILVVYTRNQVFDKAIQLSIKGIEMAEETDNYEMLIIIKSNVALIYMYLENYKKAIEMIEEVEKLAYITTDSNKLAAYVNRTVCETEDGNLEVAIEYGKKSVELSRKIDSTLYSTALSGLACAYIRNNDFAAAEEALKEAWYSEGDSNDITFRIEASIVQGELEIKKKNYSEAIRILKWTLSNIEDSKFRKELKLAYKYLAECYKAQRRYKEAFEYFEKYNTIEKEIYNINMDTNLRVLTAKKEELEKETYKMLYNQTESLYKFGVTITLNLDEENIYNTIAEEVNKFIEYDAIHIGVIDRKKNELEYQLCIENGERVNMSPTELQSESLSGYSIRNKQELLLNNMSEEYYKYIDYKNYTEPDLNKGTLEESLIINTNKKITRSGIFVPLIIKDNVIGIISVQSYKKSAYELRDLSTLKILSTYIGIALENARMYKQAEYYSMHDGLTKVYTKKIAIEKAQEMYEVMHGLCSSMTAIMLDIDNFKKINDTYGHPLGDKVIKSVSEVLRSSVRREDIVGRYGGEEFIVFLKDKTLDEIERISERIRSKIEQCKVEYNKDEIITFTVSVGVAISKNNSMSLSKLISNADQALYHVKKTGKNRVEVY